MNYHDDLLDAVATEIRGLALDRIGEKIHVKSVGDDEDTDLQGEANLPALVVSPYGSESIVKSWNNCDDISFPCLLMMFDAADKENDRAALRRRTGWRRAIFEHFNLIEFRTPNGIPWFGRVEFGPILDAGPWFEKGLYLGGMTVQAVATKVPRRRPT